MLVILILLIFLIILLYRPRFFLLAILFFSPIIPFTFRVDSFRINFFGLNVVWIDIVFIAFVMYALIQSFRGKSIINRNINVSFYLFITFIYSIFGILIGNEIGKVIYDLRVPAYFFILMLNFKSLNLRNHEVINMLLWGMVLYSIACFTLILFPFEHPFYPFVEDDNFFLMGRVTFQQDILLVLLIPFLTIRVIQEKKLYKNFINIFLLTILVGKLLIGMSRGLYFLCIFSIFLHLITLKNWRFKIHWFILKKLFLGIIFILLILGVVVIFNPVYFENELFEYGISRVVDALQPDNNFKAYQLDNRSAMWLGGIKEFLQSPLYGHGLGYVFEVDHKEWAFMKLSFVDSAYLTLAIRGGIFLVSAFLLVLVDMKYKIRYLIRNPNENNSLIFKSSSIFLTLLMLFSFVNVTLISSPAAFIIVLYLTLIFASNNDRSFRLYRDL